MDCLQHMSSIPLRNINKTLVLNHEQVVINNGSPQLFPCVKSLNRGLPVISFHLIYYFEINNIVLMHVKYCSIMHANMIQKLLCSYDNLFFYILFMIKY